jgi:hypothetical protein
MLRPTTDMVMSASSLSAGSPGLDHYPLATTDAEGNEFDIN